MLNKTNIKVCLSEPNSEQVEGIVLTFGEDDKIADNDIIDKGFHVDSDTEIDNEITEEEVFQNIVEIL